MAVSRSCWWPSLILLLLPLSPPPAPADGRLGILLPLLPLLLPGRPQKLQPRGRPLPPFLPLSYFLPSPRLLLARTLGRRAARSAPRAPCPRLRAPGSSGAALTPSAGFSGDPAEKAPLRAPEPYSHCWMLSPAMKTREPAFILLQLEYKRTAHASSFTTRPRTPTSSRADQDPRVSSLQDCPGSVTLRPSAEILGLPFLERSFFVPP